MEVRKQRRELMGDAIAVLVNGRDTGFQVEAPKCNSCGSGMEFEGYRQVSISGLEVDLQQHSYQAGLWNAAEMGQHQYLEGARRQVEHCQRLSSANDGALWIEQISASNYPQAIQIIDWGHAAERLWKVAKAAFGAGTPRAQRLTHQHIEQLWHGRARDVVVALDGLNWNQITCLDDVHLLLRYTPREQLVEVAHHDPGRFAPGATGFLTQDEESSGIIDASAILGEGWYLLVQQAHYATDTQLVEGGQLLALHIHPGKN